MQLSAEEAAGVSAPSEITGYSNHAIEQIENRDGVIGFN
jgi:filamentous hemagglutinin